MKYTIQKTAKQPAYLQLYLQMREDIINGAYPTGSKLPSKRLVAAETQVSTVTVEHAYALLYDEGYVEARQRSGYFVIFRSADGFMAAIRDTPHLSPPAQSETPAEFPFSVLARTMRSVISTMGPAILSRSPNVGCVELRLALQKYLARSRGIIADVDQIIIGSGSEYLYSLIVELLGRNKVFAIESPSYSKIEQVYGAANVQIEKLPLGHDGIDSQALRDCHGDVLHISPYRSYPSGVTATASKRHEYLRWASQGERYIVEDDFESEFSISQKAEETLFTHTNRDNVIYLNTFSKTVSASFRVGYMLLPKPFVEKFHRELGFYSCTVPTYIQFVLAELLSGGDFERHINRVRRAKRKELAAKK